MAARGTKRYAQIIKAANKRYDARVRAIPIIERLGSYTGPAAIKRAQVERNAHIERARQRIKRGTTWMFG